jgi:hypothetical protein
MSLSPRGVCEAVRRTRHGLVTRKPEPSSCTGPLEAAASHVRPLTAGCRPMTDAMMVAGLTLCMVHCLIVCMTCNGGCRRLPLQPPAQGRVHPLGVRVFGTLGAAGFHLRRQRRTRTRGRCGPPCFWRSARSSGWYDRAAILAPCGVAMAATAPLSSLCGAAARLQAPRGAQRASGIKCAAWRAGAVLRVRKVGAHGDQRPVADLCGPVIRGGARSVPHGRAARSAGGADCPCSTSVAIRAHHIGAGPCTGSMRRVPDGRRCVWSSARSIGAQPASREPTELLVSGLRHSDGCDVCVTRCGWLICLTLRPLTHCAARPQSRWRCRRVVARSFTHPARAGPSGTC